MICINDAVLLHGDALTLMGGLPAGSIDMVLTDPPYGISFQSNYRTKKHKKIAGDDSTGWLDGWAAEFSRVAADNTAHYVFCSHHNVEFFKAALGRFFKIKNILIWEKNNTGMGDLTGDYAPLYEMIIFMHKGRRLMNGKRDANILKYNRTRNTQHPTQKPVDLLEYLICKFSDEGSVVLDPFMGSGSTGVACARTGRKFIGIERDDEYFKTAVRRIAE